MTELDDLVTELEHQRAVMVLLLCDVEEWEADCGIGAWATLEKISRRLKAELGRVPCGERAAALASPQEGPGERRPVVTNTDDVALAARMLLMVAGDDTSGLDETEARCVTDLKKSVDALDAWRRAPTKVASPRPSEAPRTPAGVRIAYSGKDTSLRLVEAWMREHQEGDYDESELLQLVDEAVRQARDDPGSSGA